jgi:putative ABC transport system substrate-binding protein
MRRRDFISLLAGAVMVWPLAVRAQQGGRLRRVGVLINSAESDSTYRAYVAAFLSALHNLGWVEGKNVHVDVRWNAGDATRVRANAAELVDLKPDVVMAASTASVTELHRLAKSIPIVFVQVSDPVAQGIVTSLTRPGGNITGFSNFEFSIGGKWVELLKEVVPALARVAVMSNPDTSPQTEYFLRAIRTTAEGYGIQVIPLPVRTNTEIEQGIENIARQPGGALILPTDSFTLVHNEMIIELTTRDRLPTISGNSGNFAGKGGLMYYGSLVDLANQYRQAAGYVDRILKGANPGDLPIQLTTSFRLVLNARTAKSIGVVFSQALLSRADEVIE